jgi:hypothetical protein
MGCTQADWKLMSKPHPETMVLPVVTVDDSTHQKTPSAQQGMKATEAAQQSLKGRWSSLAN